ncbi:N-acetylglucosamine kinase [Aquamicrobium sp. LC103]|uniref:N-acetylglucosamine kinase n=1 Tax=Aquamicrobium sp. LC103 TaxID=1120658 RepID=UPI00063E809B|nr:N-acetylglucosamine kinase [Aquamicrobium sp. LC103]TKT74775.1 N-acetylglucosamine kinase [Aquamicrobium sp. LC103]
MKLILGIDGGGTSCRAALARTSGEVLGYGKSGSANIMTDLHGARDSIVEAARLAFADAGQNPLLLSSTPAVLGLAGTNVGDYRQQLLEILPFHESAVESDALIALHGALGRHDGAIAIIGTGSIFMSRRGRQTRTIGGWGFKLGDLGGGARLGRDLLEEALLAHDGIHDGSSLARAVLQHFENDPRNLVEFAARAKPRDFGSFAPMVFEHFAQGDAVAETLVARSVDNIEEALDTLDLAAGERLCLLGGLADFVAPRLSPGYRKILEPPLRDALGGAVEMAVELFGKSGSG